MRKHYEQWPPTVKRKQWRMMGAIAAPVLLAMVWWLWLLPDRRVQADDDLHSRSETATLAQSQRESLAKDVGAIAAVAGGVFLLVSWRRVKRNAETVNLSGADLKGADLSGVDFRGADLTGAEMSGADLSDADLSDADLSSADLSGADLSGANLSGANLSGTDCISANLNGADLNHANLRYANLSGADLRYANLREANLRYANLSGADLNCAFLSGANLSEANLSEALLFYINSREVQNLEPLQLKAQPSPVLCNVALPAYSQQPHVNPNRDCARLPQLLSARYKISLEEAQGIVNEAQQHRWD